MRTVAMGVARRPLPVFLPNVWCLVPNDCLGEKAIKKEWENMEGVLGKVKVTLVGVAALAAAHFGVLALPLVLLVGCNLLDYITGICAAPQRGQQRNSVRGLRGIAKKVCMWLLVAVGVVVDMLLAYLGEMMGLRLPLALPVGCVVCVWLLANEVISVIENIADLGVSVPFLLPLVRWVKKQTEAAGKAPPEDDG